MKPRREPEFNTNPDPPNLHIPQKSQTIEPTTKDLVDHDGKNVIRPAPLDLDKDPFESIAPRLSIVPDTGDIAEETAAPVPAADNLDLKSLTIALNTISQPPEKVDPLAEVKRASSENLDALNDTEGKSDNSPRNLLSHSKEKAVLLNKAVEPKLENAENVKDCPVDQVETKAPELKSPPLPASDTQPKVIPFSAMGPARGKGKDYLCFTFTKSEIDIAYRDPRFPDSFILQFICVLEEENFVITAPECWDETQYSSLMAVHQYNAQRSNACKCFPSESPN